MYIHIYIYIYIIAAVSRTLIRGEKESRRVHRRLENCVWAGLVQRSTCLFYAVTKYGEGVGMYDNIC